MFIFFTHLLTILHRLLLTATPAMYNLSPLIYSRTHKRSHRALSRLIRPLDHWTVDNRHAGQPLLACNLILQYYLIYFYILSLVLTLPQPTHDNQLLATLSFSTTDHISIWSGSNKCHHPAGNRHVVVSLPTLGILLSTCESLARRQTTGLLLQNF